MPDTRKHRGPHPADADLFGPSARPLLKQAVVHLSWLLTRGYAEPSALKLVGDRFSLTERQRIAVLRSSCSDQALEHRHRTQVSVEQSAGETLYLDGFNVLTTIEAALAGGVILLGRDGCMRDMASMHGSYRKVEETRPALKRIGDVLNDLRAGHCRWYLDSPVSNSGRLSTVIRKMAEEHNWSWDARLVKNPDAVLIRSSELVASADSAVLDRCRRWFNLAAEVVRRKVPDAIVVRLEDDV